MHHSVRFEHGNAPLFQEGLGVKTGRGDSCDCISDSRLVREYAATNLSYAIQRNARYSWHTQF